MYKVHIEFSLEHLTLCLQEVREKVGYRGEGSKGKEGEEEREGRGGEEGKKGEEREVVLMLL